MSGKINHPSYYGGKIECIDYIDAHNLGFSLGNAVKYITRAGRKSVDAREDLKKAVWYLQHEIVRLDKQAAERGEQDEQAEG